MLLGFLNGDERKAKEKCAEDVRPNGVHFLIERDQDVPDQKSESSDWGEDSQWTRPWDEGDEVWWLTRAQIHVVRGLEYGIFPGHSGE
jgi:hypothetical protein